MPGQRVELAVKQFFVQSIGPRVHPDIVAWNRSGHQLPILRVYIPPHGIYGYIGSGQAIGHGSPFFTLHLLDLPDLENDGKGEYEENGIGQVHTQYDIGPNPHLSYRVIMLSSSSLLTFIFTGGVTDS